MASALKLYREETHTPTPLFELPHASDGLPGPNRRFMPRINGNFEVRPLDGEAPMGGIDLSFGGMMCASSEPLWPGNTIEAELMLPGEDTAIYVKAKVVELVPYHSHTAMRMRFSDVSTADRKRIAQWMTRRAGA